MENTFNSPGILPMVQIAPFSAPKKCDCGKDATSWVCSSAFPVATMVYCADCNPHSMQNIIKNAVAAEKERCAKIADNAYNRTKHISTICLEVAHAIRAGE